MQLRHGLRIGAPFGIPLLVHGSWFPAAVLLAFHFALTVYSDEGVSVAAVLAVASTLLFFASLVAHELGHATVARSLGIGVRDITLFIFGGVAGIVREPSRPAQEVVIAAAGPVVSAVLGGIALAAASLADGVLYRLLWTLGAANLVLALFNLLPGFPLDGGRLLRAAIWSRSGDPHGAALAAGRAGQGIGLLMASGGVVAFVAGSAGPRGFLSDGGPEGLWLAAVGGFLFVLATASRRAAEVASRFGGGSAESWGRPFAGTLAPDTPASEAGPDGGPYAVADEGRLAGILLPGAVDGRPPGTAVRDLMVPWTPRRSFPATRPLTRALERMAVEGVLVLVNEEGGVVGVLDPDGVRARLAERDGKGARRDTVPDAAAPDGRAR